MKKEKIYLKEEKVLNKYKKISKNFKNNNHLNHEIEVKKSDFNKINIIKLNKLKIWEN